MALPLRRPKYNVTTRQAKRVVDRIARELRRGSKLHVGIETTEVFKGGSMGQGTRVPGHYDIDLVLYSRDLDPHKALIESGYKDILKRLDTFLKSKLKGNYELKHRDNVALQFTYKLTSGATLDVDLLLSPYWDSHNNFLQFLRTVHPVEKRSLFEVSAYKWQTEFIKLRMSQRIKELIVRAKAWRNVQWGESKDGRPKSFLISLLVIVAYERLPAATKSAAFKTLAARIGEEFRKLVREIATTPDLSLMIPGAPTFDDFKDLFPPKPRIIGPGNPCKNHFENGVGHVRDGDKWDIFVRKLPTFNITKTAMVIMGHYR